MAGKYEFSCGHSESFLPAPETRLLTCKYAVALKGNLPVWIQTGKDLSHPVFFLKKISHQLIRQILLFYPFFRKRGPRFSASAAWFSTVFLLFPCYSLAVFLLPAATNQQGGSRKVARKQPSDSRPTCQRLPLKKWFQPAPKNFKMEKSFPVCFQTGKFPFRATAYLPCQQYFKKMSREKNEFKSLPWKPRRQGRYTGRCKSGGSFLPGGAF